MEILIYTSIGCKWCVQIKELMSRANVEYKEVIWNQLPGEIQEQLQEQHPQLVAFPAVFIDGEFIGGVIETAKLFLQKGLVSSKKNG